VARLPTTTDEAAEPVCRPHYAPLHPPGRRSWAQGRGLDCARWL